MDNEGLEHMADDRETKTQTLESVGLTTKGLLQIFGFMVALAAGVISVDQWGKRSIDTAIRGYDAGYITPKIDRNAWNIESNQRSISDIRQENKDFREEVKQKMDAQDQSRNRQYGELKSMMNGQQEDTKKIITHLLVNK